MLISTKFKNLTIFFFALLLTVRCQEKKEEVFAPPTSEELNMEVPDVKHLLTKANESSRFEIQEGSINTIDESLNRLININSEVTFQDVDGFGFALTGGSASHLNQMSKSEQEKLLNELFGVDEGQIGLSFIRISIGSSDLDQDVFSYNDHQGGDLDTSHQNFSLAPDEPVLIPMIKKILSVNPDIKIMASPWSPPAWMKDNNSPKGGSLKEEFYNSYALYLLKYVQEMEAIGITVGYLSIQNEPLHDGNNPSMYMTAENQREFIKGSLGPLFNDNSIETKIVIYDHNADRPDYPITILNDTEAKKYVDGSAFHLYAGNIDALSVVRNAHPDKSIYFTEQWFGAPGNFSEDLKWHTREVVIGSQRNWSRNVIEWNLSSNSDLEPHTDGGCNQCLGGITIDGDAVKRNAGYYVIAHISKYVRPGSVRISSDSSDDLPNVAYTTPDEKVVLLVLNNSDSRKEFNVVQGDVKFSTALDPGSVSTYVWAKK
ncbi:MAG: glycoside hydrolase family 30 beta sandwich domain-containing protein [Ekhidna sp.]